jgi:hypothetical protein
VINECEVNAEVWSFEKLQHNNEFFTRGKGMMTWVFDSQED